MADWNRFDICIAHHCLENDWNVGGWVRERPSNRRRMESTHVQLDRIGFSFSYGPGNFEGLLSEEYENAAEIYVNALIKFGLAKLVDPEDELGRHIVNYYVPDFVAEHFPQLIKVAA